MDNAEAALLDLVAGGIHPGQTEDIRSLVRARLLSDPGLTCMIHPVGFYHFRLSTAGRVTLRLHYWPDRDRPLPMAPTPYHDHVWTLESLALAGGLENDMIALEDDVEGEYLVADITQVEGVDTVIPTTQRVRISDVETAGYSKGQVYYIPPRRFHCSRVPPMESAATVVRSEVVVEGGPRTLVPVGYAGQAPKRKYLPASATQRMRESIAALLNPTG